MRFIIDTNLPPALADWLRSNGHEAEHTLALGMASASDRSIRSHARAIGAVIVTKDEDFVLLKATQQDGPQVIWIRIGNATRKVLLQRLTAVWAMVEIALCDGEGIIEVR